MISFIDFPRSERETTNSPIPLGTVEGWWWGNRRNLLQVEAEEWEDESNLPFIFITKVHS